LRRCDNGRGRDDDGRGVVGRGIDALGAAASWAGAHGLDGDVVDELTNAFNVGGDLGGFLFLLVAGDEAVELDGAVEGGDIDVRVFVNGVVVECAFDAVADEAVIDVGAGGAARGMAAGESRDCNGGAQTGGEDGLFEVDFHLFELS
jgi:hypothetical protein